MIGNVCERFKYGAEIISKNANGRKIIVWGDRNNLFDAYLKDKYGLEVAFQVFWDLRLIDRIKTFHMQILADNKDAYYVVNLAMPYTKKNAEYLESHGYVKNVDFCFLGVPSHIVSKGMVDYCDNQGNSCNYCPDNCTITFKGNNAKVFIGHDVRIKSQLNISLKDECALYIGNRTILGGGVINQLANSSISIGKDSFYMGTRMNAYENSQIKIGENCTIFGALFSSCSDCIIEIGNNCLFSEQIIFFAGDGHAIFDLATQKRINYAIDLPEDKRSIKIKNHCWIGIRASVLAGTCLGENSIVGAQSLVKGKFGPNCIVAGNPAKVIREHIIWDRNIHSVDINSCIDYMDEGKYKEVKNESNCNNAN